MITIKYLKDDAPREDRIRVSTFGEEPRDKVALQLLQADKYEDVAVVDTDSLERAYMLTQNGVVSDSWSQLPPEGVRPVEPGYVEIDGKRYGYRTSMMGDVFVKDGEAFVVDTIGFKKIEGWTESPAPSLG